jgi:transcription elongation factor GreA
MTVQLPNDSIRSTAGNRSTPHGKRARVPAGPALMTAATLDELRDELHRLRELANVETAQRLRDARGYGEGSNNDEYHAVREDQMVLEARIASLEATIGRARIVESRGAGEEIALIGATVLIEDLDSGAVKLYRLVSAHHSLGPEVISAGSPMGQAIVGTTPGTIGTVELPNGRFRRVRLLEARNRRPRSSAANSRLTARPMPPGWLASS